MQGSFVAPKTKAFIGEVLSITEIDRNDKTFYELVISHKEGIDFVSSNPTIAEDIAIGSKGAFMLEERIGGVTNYLDLGQIKTHEKTGYSLMRFAEVGKSSVRRVDDSDAVEPTAELAAPETKAQSKK
jgi:hypothetical protein